MYIGQIYNALNFKADIYSFKKVISVFYSLNGKLKH